MTLHQPALVPSQAVLVVDHPLLRAGLVTSLAREPDLEVLSDVTTAQEALEAVKTRSIDIAVIDVATSRRTLDLLSDALRPRCKILVLSVFDEPAVIATLFRAGVSGYVLKTQPPDQIIEAIRVVLGGESYLPPRAPAATVWKLVDSDSEPVLDRLTAREREIFELLIRGYSNDEIAAQLAVARRTVETHRQRILKKLSAHSILDMIRLTAWHWATSP